MVRGVAWVLAWMLVAAGGEALAESPSGGSAGPGVAASVAGDALRRGEAARRAGRWAEAKAAYRAAWDAAPTPALAGELGLCELELGEHREAAEHLRRALAESAALTPAQQRRFAEGQRRAAREVAAVEILVSHAQAEVFLDGERLGQGEALHSAFVAPGRHEVRAALAGHVGQTARFEAVRGGAASVPLVLDPVVPVPARVEAKPAAPPVLVAGVQAAPDGTGRAVRIVGFALASAGVVLGTGFAIAAAVKADEEEALRASILARRGEGGCVAQRSPPSDCEELRHLGGLHDVHARAASMSFLVGGVLGAVAVSSFWWAPSPPERRVTVRAQVGVGGAGVSVNGAW